MGENMRLERNIATLKRYIIAFDLLGTRKVYPMNVGTAEPW